MLKSSFSKVALALALVAAIFMGSMRPASAFLDKTRFLAHLGVAYFAFHHWVMKPYQQGSFQNGAPHRTLAIVKAGAALLFAVHEVHVSEKIAQHSRDPLLQKLNAGLGGLVATFTSVGQRMKAGQFNPADIGNLNSEASSVQSNAAQNGARIKDVPAAIPGT